MKSLAMLIIATFIFTCIFSQEKINGLGVFKIGQPISVVEDYARENKIKISTVDSYSDYSKYSIKKEPYIIEIKKNTDPKHKYDSPAEAPECEKSRVFIINGYSVADIQLKQLTLDFFNGSLYKIDANYDEKLVDALTVKYGEPETTKKVDSVTCLYNLTGNRVTKTSNTFTKTWKNNQIVTYASIGSYFNDKCKENFLSYVIISDTIVSRQENECSLTAMDLEDAKQKPKKENLKDL